MKLSDKIVFVILLIVIISIIFIKLFSTSSERILLDYAVLKSTNKISSIINDSINNVLYYNNYDNIIKDYKDKDGNIVNVDFDNLIVNRLLYLINENMMNSINKINTNDFYYVPFGVSYNISVLNNLGPKIPFKIDFLGSINNDTSINVKEYGINSYIIEFNLNLNINMKVIMPFSSKNVNISKAVILDSKIVQGKVPDYYGGLISNSLK